MKFGRSNFLMYPEPQAEGGGFDFEAMQAKAEELEAEEIEVEEGNDPEPEEPSEEPPVEEPPVEEPPVEESTEEPPVEQDPEAKEVVAPAEGDVEPPSYEANLNYKALDQEYSMPEFLKDAITSKEQEDQLREVFQKAEGLSHIKSKNEHLKTELETLKPQYEEQTNTLNYLDHLVDNKDIDNIQKMARLSDDDILNHAAKILERQGLTPEQQEAYNREVENRNSQFFTSQENATLRDVHYQQQVQNQNEQLDITLQNEEVRKYVDFYNERVGDQTDFRKSVIDYAVKVLNDSQGKTNLTVKQAVDGFINSSVKPFYVEPQPEQTPETETSSEPAVVQTPPVDPREKPVMPTVQGGASKSPAKPVFKSIADLVAHREKYFETE